MSGFLDGLPVGRRLAARRVGLDLTQAEVAALAGVAEGSVARAEADDKLAGVAALAEIHLALLDEEKRRRCEGERPDLKAWQAVLLAARLLREGVPLEPVLRPPPSPANPGPLHRRRAPEEREATEATTAPAGASGGVG